MVNSTNIKNARNSALRPINVEIDTLTKHELEPDCIQRQLTTGHFNRPTFPLLDGMEYFEDEQPDQTYATCQADLERSKHGTPPANPTAHTFFIEHPMQRVSI